jgi:hypothetical protein
MLLCWIILFKFKFQKGTDKTDGTYKSPLHISRSSLTAVMGLWGIRSRFEGSQSFPVSHLHDTTPRPHTSRTAGVLSLFEWKVYFIFLFLFFFLKHDHLRLRCQLEGRMPIRNQDIDKVHLALLSISLLWILIRGTNN